MNLKRAVFQTVIAVAVLAGGGGVVSAQTLGGQAVFTFLNEGAGPQVNALGGVNVSNAGDDVMMAFAQPALLRDSMHLQMGASINAQYAGIDDYHWMLAYHHAGLGMNFALGGMFVDYGSITETDPSGNILGQFRPHDYDVQGTVAGRYLDRWYYGFTLKFIGSDLGPYRSSGIAGDVGLNYQIGERGWQFGLTAVNMGTQLKSFEGSGKEELPFDLRAGVSKRLLKAPFQFSLTLVHLHQWNLDYADSAFNAQTGAVTKTGFGHKLMEHVILGAQLFASKYIEVSLGYNYLLRQELSVASTSNGLTGVSFGVGVLLPQITFRYARTAYQLNTGYNQVGLGVPLERYVGGRKKAS
ncbi:type IX secretion system protein PorQ [Dinghuibacter silviterrae]|uniref:Type IX secretion system PorP/SprF family membrane protein n=1 Tax=Dinghuibacter silviterrae TaxID=1539049 RepID=A0A4R8DEP9_9BACT|nr:type IX secretion system protein PorQ [Dinghuibacter silviterrae]TDW96021.1 hypothetical protein EDB95_3843 [Dinghuibacter silviterrae]